MESIFRYFSSPESKQWGITVQTCGHQVTLPGQPYPPQKHPASHAFEWTKGRKLKDIHILYVVTGSGDIETAKQKRRIRPGDIILLYPNEWHRYRPDRGTGWEEYWIGFNGPQVDEYLLPELFHEPTTTIKNIVYHDEVIYLFQQSLSLAQRKTIAFQKILTGIIWQLAGYIATPLVKPSPGATAQHLADDTLEYIRLNLKQGVDFHKRAETVGMSYSHFRKLIREKTGHPPQQLLIQERVRLAERLLQSTALTINEIATATGFESVYYFSACFKDKTGQTPSSWRNNHSY
jgi:AraC-like DNA-binding protein